MRLRPPNYFILFLSLMVFGCASQEQNQLSTSSEQTIIKPYCYSDAAQEFMRWNKSSGQVLNGLTLRRREEMELFLKDCNDSL